MKSKIKNRIKVIPLGGLGEIGKNITVIEYKDEIIVIDCGISFPGADMYGVDLVIPNITYLLENREKVKGFFLTHGHEDHIGALPYVLKQLNVPVYGTSLTLGLVKNKLEEHNLLSDCELNVVKSGSVAKLENISVEFVRNSHSIPDSCAIVIHTPIGRIVHTGDFKIDYTPIDGEIMDLERFSKLGKQGVLLLLADSTNVERPGYTISEKVIGESLNKIFGKATGRVIVATFASHIHRLQQIVNASILYGRKIAFSGRSMEKISKVAMELGYLNIPEDIIINIDQIHKYPSEKITLMTTGSQGEPMSALTRIAAGIHKSIQITKGDSVIISASPISGNEKCISNVINDLFKRGADVIYDSLEDVHVSGHACQEELKLIHTLVKPKYFMPVHGEYRHLIQHGILAEKLGMDKSNIFVGEVGQVLEVHNKEARISGKVQTGAIMVDGLGVGDVGSIVLRDRKLLSQDGILTVVITIEKASYSIVAGPDIITRGFIYAKESESLINEARNIVREEVENSLKNKTINWTNIKFTVRNSLAQFLYMKIQRRPIIMPIIMEV